MPEPPPISPLPSPSPHCVLIVEDERIVARDLQQTLAAMGYDAAAIASSSDDALSCAAERVPDLVLMDIRIKGSHDGIETAELLRSRFGVPVVYLTAHADDATLERARRTVPYGYLMKPIKPAELRSAIEVSIHRHRMEKQLRARERWFATTLRSLDDAVIAVDLAGEVTFMNAAAERLTGTTAEAAAGKPAREVVHLLDPAQPASPLDDVLAQRRQLAITEAELAAPGSSGRIISGTASLVMDGGELLGAVMVARDVTDHRRVQRQLEVADRLASLGTLTSGVAHQINNPLAVVLANASYARSEIDDIGEAIGEAIGELDDEAAGLGDRLRELAQVQAEIAAAAARIGKIVADLKLFARPPELAPGTADVGRAIEWAVRTTAHEFRHRAGLRHEVASALRAVADETRLRQVFVNLLLNAAQAVPAGDSAAHAIAIRAREAGGRIVVEVHDTGPGIPADNLRRIFEPFFTTRALGEGTGLGLSVCHGIVTSMGGAIEVDSEPGQGTTFRVTLPAAPAAGPPAAPAPAPATVVRRGRILVVHDDVMVNRALQRLLRDHELVCTDNPRDALAIVGRGERFDFILSELMMPVMTGMAFHAELRGRDPELADRIVFVTGDATASAQTDAFLRSVPNVTLEKPFGVPDIQALVARMLGDAAAPG